jgi:hypothetical protein
MKLFLNAGAGDVFALESCLTPDVRASIREIHWATRISHLMTPLFIESPTYGHIFHVRYPVTTRSFFTIEGAREEFPIPPDVLAWSIGETFSGSRTYTPSAFLTDPSPDLSRFDLPRRYVLLLHQTTAHTSASQRALRDLTQEEWRLILDRLEREDLMGVLVNSGDTDPPPESPRILDLRGQTSIAESIGILKRAQGFWGIASALTVLAAQIFQSDQLWVKGPEANLHDFRHHYFAPHVRFPFLYYNLGDELPVKGLHNCMHVRFKELRIFGNEIRSIGSVVEATPEQAADLVKFGHADYFTPTDNHDEAVAKIDALQTAIAKPVKKRARRFEG